MASTPPDRLDIDYGSHDRVRRLRARIRYALESISLRFDQWEVDRVEGPGMYVALVSGHTVAPYADPMGDDRWPVERARTVLDDEDAFYDAAREVALGNDGAVVVGVDGVVQESMVRFRDPEGAEPTADYAPWMGSRHMSALDVSAHPAVVATLTLSGESGRVTEFVDGEYESHPRDAFAAKWHGGS